MHFQSIMAAVALAISAASAQSIADLPACAQTCILNSIGGSGCAVTDVPCICKSATFLSSYDACLATSCNAADQFAAINFGVAYCAGAGVTVAVPQPSSTSSSAEVPETSATPYPTTTAKASMSPTGTAAPSTYSAPPAYTGAAGRNGVWAGAAVGAVGLAAFL